MIRCRREVSAIHDHDDHHPGHDHDHDGWLPDPADLELVDGVERHTLRSVGIDIGSATCQLVLSRLVFVRKGAALSSDFVVAEREIVFRGPVALTPYADAGSTIDVRRLREWLERWYAQAGVTPAEVDTGAVIITGEALKKENAEKIARMVADWSGRLVCVSAGPNHEAVLAAHGSGAVARSRPGGTTVVNIDLGGGTAKVSVVRAGVVDHVESVSVGARLLAVDPHGALTRIEDPARFYLGACGLPATLGARLGPADRARVAGRMADVLLDALTGRPDPTLLVATDGRAMPALGQVDEILISGGVSEFLGPNPPTNVGDLGAELADAVLDRLTRAGLGDRVKIPVGGIRATVLGASQFTVQASGQTCFISDRSALPARALRAIPVDLTGERVSAQALTAELARRDVRVWHAGLAAVPRLPDRAGYARLRAAAVALTRVVPSDVALYVILREDLAHSLGAILVHELGRPGPTVVVDGITVGELDHVDLGQALGSSGALPVTVTSLLFPDPTTAGVRR